jgi:TolA-binding protein
MKMIFVFMVLVLGILIGGLTVLQNGSLRRYVDAHPEKEWVPAVEYYLGEGYFIVGNLEDSATYYQRVTERFPKSPYADDSYFNYLQDLDDQNAPRADMIQKYEDYLARYPNGEHALVVEKRIENYKNKPH